MHKSFAFGIALLLSLSFPLFGQSEKDEVRILRSDQNSLVLEYRPHYTSPSTIKAARQEFTLYDFLNSIPRYTAETVGSPDIRMRKLPLGFPSTTGNTLQVIASDYEDIPNTLLAPVPSLRVRDEVVEVKEYAADQTRYSQDSFLPGGVARLSSVSQARSMLVGSVEVFPVQFNPATRTVRKYSRVVIEVVFGAPAGQRAQNSDDLPFQGVLLNYNQAKAWKFESARSLSKTSIVPSVLATGSWYRLTVVDDGVYILSAQYLASAGISLSGIDPRTIKVFGNGGTELPQGISQTRPVDLVENAVVVEGEADGQFNSSDYVLFYGKGVRGWKYNPTRRTLNHYINHYTEVNYYWLTFGGSTGKRMQPQPSLAENPTIVTDKFLDATFIEEEKTNILKSGKDWYGVQLSPGGSTPSISPLPGLVPEQSLLYRYQVIARAEVAPMFTVKQAEATIGTHQLQAVYYESPFTYATALASEGRVSSTIADNISRLTFTFSAGDIGGTGWVDWVEILYPRRLDAVNNFLRFRSPDSTGIVEYQIGQFSAAPLILNVTRPDEVRLITGITGTYRFRAAESAGQVSEYCAASSSAFKTPAGIIGVDNQNLRGYPTGADFIIITSADFRSAADQLAAYREQPGSGNLRTLVADVNQIYNEFGGGIPDITAIRDFLKYAYDNWTPRPRYVLMLGQGSYDYKGIVSSRSSRVPTWQSDESRDDVGSWATDDYFARFGSSNALSLVLGRISARTSAQAVHAVEKIKRYEENSSRDTWKTRMLYIGDDSWTPDGEDGTIHSEAAEQLAQYFTPEEFDKKKIYIAEYQTVQSSAGRRKPGAYQDVIDQVNRGVLTVNWTGHGNPTVWAHEAIFSVPTSIPQLINANKLSVFFAATCNFSQFDDPSRETGSEILINKPDGGAIGVVSATRKVFAGSNNYLHQSIFLNLFRRTPTGRFADLRVATALYLFKATGGNDVNDQKFFFMGDPTMELQYPKAFATIDSINQEAVDTLNGLPRLNPIRLKSLAKVIVKGTIRAADNRPDSTFTGRASLVVNDVSRTILIPEFAPNTRWDYVAPGSTIYRGQSSVLNGKFRAEFLVPKDISYGDSLARGRLVGYFYNDIIDGAGFTTKISLGGADTNATNDVEGPGIRLYLDSRAFRDGDLVSEQPMLFVDLADSSGINTSTSGVGHRLEAWINNAAQSKDFTEFYASKLDSYQEGTAQYQLKDLSKGRNSVRVKAWDTYNNASTAETFFEVTSSNQLTISAVMNYPNPFARETAFTFRQNQLVPLNVKVKVYTISGRLIQSLEAFSAGEPFILIPWDGRDRDGDELANGVYLYKVIVRTADGRFNSEALGKLAVVR